jgi:hypothetical protein
VQPFVICSLLLEFVTSFKQFSTFDGVRRTDGTPVLMLAVWLYCNLRVLGGGTGAGPADVVCPLTIDGGG